MAGLFILLSWVACFIAWVVHVVTCLKAASWVLLVIGAVFFPIGIIHGFGVMLGVM